MTTHTNLPFLYLSLKARDGPNVFSEHLHCLQVPGSEGDPDLTEKMVQTNRQRFEMDKLRNQIKMETEKVNKVLIIGAGATGLALAQGLKKAGIPCMVYEKHDSLETRRDWGFGIHWGLDSLKELLPEEIFARLETTQVDPHIPQVEENYGVPIFDGSSGKLIKVLASSKCYRLRRDKLRKLLAEGLDIRFGKELHKIELTGGYRTVAARFTDGTQNTGRLLIGCDGAKSLVRRNLVGGEAAQLKPLGLATAMCYSKHTAERAKWLRSPPFHPIQQLSLHPDGKVAWLSVHDAEDQDHPENWTFIHYISYPAPPDHDTWDSKQLLQHQKELAKTFCDPWKSIYEWMPDDSTEVSNTSIQDWDPSLPHHAWDNQFGRVTLAGDAAHPMSFQRGQGLNNALQDALELCRAAAKCWQDAEFAKGEGTQTRRAAINAYEAEMKERGGREVKGSAENSRMVHSFGERERSGLVRCGLRASGKEEEGVMA